MPQKIYTAVSNRALVREFATWIMPPPKLWTFVHCLTSRCLFVKSGEDLKRGYGAVLDVRCNKEKSDSVKVNQHNYMYIVIVCIRVYFTNAALSLSLSLYIYTFAYR